MAFVSHAIFATDRHWNGATNTTWGTSTNWDTAVPGSADNAVFDGTFSNQPNVGVATTVGGLWMTGSVGQNVTLSGTTLTLQGNTISGTSGLGILIDNANSFTLTINAPLKVGAAQTWRNNSSNLCTIGGGGVNTNGFALTIDGSGSTSISGVVSGSGAITKSGTSSLTLSGTNTYTGATTVSMGVVNIQNAAALGTTATGTTVSGGAALQIQGNIAVGAEALTLNGSGISNDGALRNISGTNSMSGAVTLGSASTIGSDAGTLTLSGNIINSGFLLTTVGAGNLTLSGVMSGTGGLTINGPGTVTLTGSNTYTGTTTVSAGTLALNNTSAVNGALVIGDNVHSAGYATVQLLAANQLSNTTSVTVNPSGILNLNGFADTINNGLIVESGDTAGASVTNSGAAKLTLKSDVTLNVMGTGAVGATISGNITDGGAIRTFTVNDGAANADLTISAVMQGSKGYIKAGAGRLVLSAANANTGTFTINAGPVQLQNADAISTFSGTTVNAGGALELAGGIAFNPEPLTLNGSGVGGTGALLNVSGINTFGGALTIGSATTFGSNSGTLTLSDTFTNAGFLLTMTGAGNLTFSGVLSGTGGITKTGAGILTLSGLNTFTGVTTLSGGVESVATINNGGVASNFGKASNAASNLVFDGGTLQYTGATASTDRNFTINTGKTATFDVTTNTLTLTGASTATNGALTKIGAGTLVLSGANLYTGATNINVGTLKEGAANVISDSSAVTVASGATYDLNSFSETIGSLAGAGTVTSGVAGSLTLTAGADNTTTLFSGVIQNGSGTVSLTKSGTGTLTLSGTNSYTGATTVSAGVLNIQSATGLGTTAAGTTVSSGATLQLQGGITVGAEALTLSGTGAAGQNGALVNVSGTNNYGGLLTLGAATTISSDSGTLNLTNVGTITGATFGLTLTGSGSGTVSGIIGTTTGTLTKSGSGTWTLTGANTYTGATTVNAGSLFVTGSTASGNAFTVNNSGTTVGGSGTISGSLNLASAGSNLSPGASGAGSISILNTGSVTLGLGSNFNVDVNNTTAGTGYDQLKVTGTLSITGSNLVITAGPGLSIGDTFYIVLNDASDAITGTFAQGATVMASNNSDVFLINYAANADGGIIGNDISITVTALPEPGTYIGGILALAILFHHERRKLFRLITRPSHSFSSICSKDQ